ncbi:MAG TPA: HlyD family secretion protein, partial [Novosphingobium sp.]|nr:HlyD family secretion protein [Novosphingobium sp.]
GWLIHYELVGQYLEETNDAQVQADAITIAPRISGYVAEVLVTDNQDVKAGQPLVRIDPRDFRAHAAQAKAAIDIAKAQADNIRAGIEEQQSTIEQSRAQLSAAQAKAKYDADQVRRYAPLVATGAEQAQQLAQLRTAAQQSADQARAQAATLAGQERRVATLQAQVRQAEAQARSGGAQLDLANVDVDATLLRASANGRIGDKTVTVGQYAQSGTRLMSIVPLDKVYVVANFKETQLAHMHPGQTVTIKVDAMDGHDIKGHIESMAPGTGASFSLIPPQNATGNFTKIVQRVPVRIRIDPGQNAGVVLVPGLSVTATVHTKAGE